MDVFFFSDRVNTYFVEFENIIRATANDSVRDTILSHNNVEVFVISF